MPSKTVSNACYGGITGISDYVNRHQQQDCSFQVGTLRVAALQSIMKPYLSLIYTYIYIYISIYINIKYFFDIYTY